MRSIFFVGSWTFQPMSIYIYIYIYLCVCVEICSVYSYSVKHTLSQPFCQCILSICSSLFISLTASLSVYPCVVCVCARMCVCRSACVKAFRALIIKLVAFWKLVMWKRIKICRFSLLLLWLPAIFTWIHPALITDKGAKVAYSGII